MADLEAIPPAPQQPLNPSRTASDPTFEGLVKLYENGNPALGLFTDEGGSFFGGHAMNSDNKLKTCAGGGLLCICMTPILIAVGVLSIAFIAAWLLMVLVACQIAARSNVAVGIIGPGQNSSALTGVSTCEEAQAALAATNETVAATISNRYQKAAIVASLQQQVNVAKVAVIGAGVAVAASFLFPLSLLAALATLAAATAYLANRSSALAAAESALALAEAQLVQAISEQAAAETMVEQLCDKELSTGIISTGDVPGFTVG